MIQRIFYKGLAGILSDPFNKHRPIVIVCHGFASSKESKTFIDLQDRLNKKNIATLRFDFFGHGESEGKFEDLTISKAVDNILCMISYLKSKGYQRIGLFGSSFGGMASLLAASETKYIEVLALKSPVSNYLGVLIADLLGEGIETWKKQGFIIRENNRLNYSFFEDASNVDGYKAAEKVSVPTLIVHGDADEIVPIEQSKKTASIIKRCRLQIIAGADHGYTRDSDFEKMIDLFCRFFNDHFS